MSSGKVRGAAQAKEALIAAFLRLVAERGVSAVSVRDVAAAAGVNHGLVHRHFGSKDGLVRAALARSAERVHADARPGLSARSFAVLLENPLLPVVVARTSLDGPRDLLKLAAPPPARLAELVAPMRRLLAAVGLDVDPHVVNALGTAALLGWFVFRPLFEKGYGLPKKADAEVRKIMEAIDRIMRA